MRRPLTTLPEVAAQTADVFRSRAAEALDTVRQLRAFSTTRDFCDLDDVFRESENLEKAAVSLSPLLPVYLAPK